SLERAEHALRLAGEVSGVERPPHQRGAETLCLGQRHAHAHVGRRCLGRERGHAPDALPRCAEHQGLVLQGGLAAPRRRRGEPRHAQRREPWHLTHAPASARRCTGRSPPGPPPARRAPPAPTPCPSAGRPRRGSSGSAPARAPPPAPAPSGCRAPPPSRPPPAPPTPVTPP